MSRPVLFAVADEREELRELAGDLRRRYGADYRVLTSPSGPAALRRLARLRDQGEQVALLVADLWMPTLTGIDLLARAHALHPGARRLLLFPSGDTPAFNAIVQAMTFHDLDSYLAKP